MKGQVSIRQRRIGNQIREILSEILIREPFYDENSKRIMISISYVEISADLQTANIFIYSSHSDKETKEYLDPKKFRAHVASALSMKFCPVLRFLFDKSLENAYKIDELLRKIPKYSENDENC